MELSPSGVLAVPHGEDDDVPLVPLHVLQALYEERLLPGLGQKGCQLGVLGHPALQLLDDGHLLGLGECHHSQRLPGAAGHVIDDQVGHLGGLFLAAHEPALFPAPSGDVHE